MIALIDNFDSFTYNLVALFEALGEEVCVIKADSTQALQIIEKSTHLVISPGPGHPKDARLSLEMIERFYRTKPILGVCLGHQCIAYAFGNPVQKGLSPIHGKTAKLHFQNSKLFQGISLQTQVMRYHSLCVPNVSAPLKAIAWSEDGVIMALQHQNYPLYGVQFHPESILTQEGAKMIENFLKA